MSRNPEPSAPIRISLKYKLIITQLAEAEHVEEREIMDRMLEQALKPHFLGKVRTLEAHPPRRRKPR